MKKFVIVMLSALATTIATQATFAQGDAAAGQAKSALCATCHGADGNSELSINPKIAGQKASYIVKQLQEFKSGVRANATMSAMAAGLSDQDMADIAPWMPPSSPQLREADPEALELGASIYRSGNKDLSVAACSACHGPAGKAMNLPDSLPLAASTPNTPCCSCSNFALESGITIPAA